MFWADRIAHEIVDSGKFRPFRVDDMFTPSGYAHIGSLRGPLVHDMIYRALKDAGQDVGFTYVFNDFDTVDGLPPDMMERFADSLGKPLRLAPSPDPKYSSFADFFASDFRRVLESLGMGATFLSSWDMYHEGKFDGAIREALDHADTILDIYERVSGSKKREKGWLPLQVICEKCGKLGTTRVHDWDGQTVGYTCEPHLVTWATGCGYTGRISPFTGNGKLPWKVDWPAHWKVLGITVEGAGKDHSSAGGSRDMAREECRDVFHIAEPFNLPYEFFLIGGKKMSSSKGLGLKGRDLTDLLPPAVGRFLFVRTDYRQAIEFDPMGTMAIPDLYDEYDRCFRAYTEDGDPNFARAYELSQIKDIPAKERLFVPRFRDVANYVQLANIDLKAKFAEIKGSPLSDTETAMLAEREKYAKVWITQYAPDQYKMRMREDIPPEAAGLSDRQRKFLAKTAGILNTGMTADELQLALYDASKDMGIPAKEAFGGIYTAFMGKTFGPKAAWFLLQYPRDQVIERLIAVSRNETGKAAATDVATIDKPEFFVIDPKVRAEFPSVSVGMALITGVTVAKTDPGLEEEKTKTLEALRGITTESMGTMPEIVSYRTLYKRMGIDWHSRRPSPEALLRRVAQGKDLYSVNTCVDAYNLTVLRHRVSVGAFDASAVKFPTALRFAGAGDKILLLGDTEPTVYSERELAYYDGEGGYNIDFNYRDAQRTKVTEATKDVWINVDGIFDISPSKVGEVLEEAVAMITKYCGGTVVFSGVTK